MKSTEQLLILFNHDFKFEQRDRFIRGLEPARQFQLLSSDKKATEEIMTLALSLDSLRKWSSCDR